MKPDLFNNLPSEIITEIFLRLPAVSIPISKCVCKRWLHLLEPDDFVKSHFARSAPALVVLGDSGPLKVLELEGQLELDLERDPLTKYDLPYHRGKIMSSVNGLLVLSLPFIMLCNPITREVIKLDLPSEPSSYGFGASKITGQYKAVCIKYNLCDEKLEYYVYTLGTGSWRRLEGNPYEDEIAPGDFIDGNIQIGPGAFVNGNLHWTGSDASWIYCFDLETECFSFFKAPPYPYHPQGLPFVRNIVFALSGCLWFCNLASEYEDDGGRCELIIWIMKEYGVDESWSKEYVIPLDLGAYYMDYDMTDVAPVKVFENGDLLMLVTILLPGRRLSYYSHLFYYYNKTKTMQKIDLLGAGKASGRVKCGLFTPTLVSLKTLGLGVENVTSF